MLFSDMKDEITLYMRTRNAATSKDEYIRVFLSKVFMQSTRAVKGAGVGLMSANNYICLIPLHFVDAHGKIYAPWHVFNKLTIEERRETYWTVDTSAYIFLGILADEPPIVPSTEYASITALRNKYAGATWTITSYDECTEGSPEIHHLALGGA